jgi:F-box protein 9
MEDSNDDLVSFRQQWRAEVSARSKAGSLKAHAKDPVAQKPPSKHPGPSRLTSQPLTKGAARDEEDFIDMPAVQGGIGYAKDTFGDVEDAENASSYGKRREPMSALEHYERAVEREVQGNLGDSLHLYRKAFRVCYHCACGASYLTTGLVR